MQNKFNYPELETIALDGMRVYGTPEGNFYPSVTTMLGKTTPPEKLASLEKWKASLGDDAARISKEITDHGERVHLYIEYFLRGMEVPAPVDDVTELAYQSLNTAKPLLKKIDELWGLEVCLYSDTLCLAGRSDCIGIWQGKPAIIDFKTSKRIKTDLLIEDYKYQLAIYSIMHNEMFGTDISTGVILMIADYGFPQRFTVDLIPYQQLARERTAAFYSQLTI